MLCFEFVGLIAKMWVIQQFSPFHIFSNEVNLFKSPTRGKIK